MTPDQIKKMREERAEALAACRKILDDAKKDGERNLSAEEEERYDKIFDKAQDLAKQISRGEKLLEAEREMETTIGRVLDPPDPGAGDPTKRDRRTDDEPREMRWKLANGTERIIPLDGPRASREYQQAFAQWVGCRIRDMPPALQQLNDKELRALQADVLTAGGATVPDVQFMAKLIQKIDDFVYIRQLATVFMVTSADSLGAPALDNDPADDSWTTELLTGAEDSTMTFGGRELHPHPLAKRIKVSNKLIRVSALPIEQIVRDRLAYKNSITQEKAFMTGSGASQPLGVFTASADGISTSRDMSTGNTTTAIGADNLRHNKYNMKAPYRSRPTTRWIFHRDAINMISRLKDAEGQYLWKPGITEGDPDRLLNIPVLESEYAPNTFTTGLYVGILGDFSNYWIADALSVTIQRLIELYAETNQVGFILRSECDGMPVLEEAFSRVKLA